MSQTILDLLQTRAERICEEGTKLIREFSGMHPVNRPGDSMVFISAKGNQFWNELPSGGKQIQVRLLPEIDRLTELIRTLIQNLPNGIQRDLIGSLEMIRSSVEQEETTWWKTREEAVNGFRSLTKEIISTLETYFDNSSVEALAIVDTNALIQNPDIENWRFDRIEQFTIILTPAILSDLDSHKINHRNQQVREKASSIIRKLKEYRRRGHLYEGVVVVKGKVALRSIANEPNMAQSLSWLDANNSDDRFLASAIEVMRADIGKEAFIVTGDINLQNKIEMAGLPFCEVPQTPAELGKQ